MKSIKKSALSRAVSIAKLGLKTGAKATGNYLTGNQDQEEYLISQMKLISEELGELKGSLMKVGQGLSMYGEHFLPPKANAFLKSLQNSSPPLGWDAIETTIEKELGLKALAELDIEETPLASASLGQVHKAKIKKTGEEIALKVQYPGVDQAVHSDIKTIRRIFSFAKIFPSEIKLEEIFKEIQSMLHQELDYRIEQDWTQKTRSFFEEDSRYIIPKVYPEYSTSKILATEFIEAEAVDSPAVKALNDKSRKDLGLAFLDYYLRELFDFKAVQSDPHLGNYKIKIDQDGSARLVLLDFGAIKSVPSYFAQPFKKLIQAALEENFDQVVQSGIALNYLREDDSLELKEAYYKMCQLIVEPFHTSFAPEEFINDQQEYLWNKTDLPKRVAKAGTQLAKNFKLRTPPKDSLFLDRKLGGSFIFLSVLGLTANLDDWITKRLKELPDGG